MARRQLTIHEFHSDKSGWYIYNCWINRQALLTAHSSSLLSAYATIPRIIRYGVSFVPPGMEFYSKQTHLQQNWAVKLPVNTSILLLSQPKIQHWPLLCSCFQQYWITAILCGWNLTLTALLTNAVTTHIIITVCWHCTLIYTPIFGLYTVSVK